MTGRIDVERILDAYLAPEADQLADRVIEASLSEIARTPQRRALRAPWRFQLMTPTARSWTAAAAVIVLAGGVLIALVPRGVGPSATPSQTAALTPTFVPTAVPLPSLPPLGTEFESTWYGYRISFPIGWQTTPGQGPWPVGLNLLHGNPHLDEIKGRMGTHEARFVGASVALPIGMDLQGFRAFASPPGQSCDTLDPLEEPLRIDGVEATVSLNGCASLSSLGGNIWDIVLVAGGRGYDFTVDGFISAADAKVWLHRIVLEPSQARSATPGPSGP